MSNISEPLKPKADKNSQLEETEEYNSHKRNESTKFNLHKVLIIGLWVSFIGFSIVFGVRVLHFILPLGADWLSAEQLQGIDKLIFSGAIGGFMGKYFNNKISV